MPLNTSKAVGEEQEVTIRRHGILTAHALEKYLGEMILVYMDIAVKCEADLLLYRMRNNIDLCASKAQCEKARAVLEKVVKVMGLEFDEKQRIWCR